ncbi:DNA gyrase subunit A [Candidatus Woesearchaeota archaeon CG1_02_57_44]|nr:MAG: DNA gyrase subunit A [Candidatus Woesearchaeota archaeon CG1_02_57_44]
MRQSYLEYAMSVIVGRALPDVRDGLKPVHRRVLFGMQDLSLTHDKPYKKSARIVGEVLGKYHPHGDMAVYDTLVRMAQDFSLRYLLVNGQGNFGSIDGDNPAAMRYTEARMTRIAEEMLKDLEKETVDFQENFDNTLKEPTVLPSAIPNLLVNGSSGIAVGMATNIPPHNMAEVCKAVGALIDNPDITVEQLNAIVPGPDFPTGGIIMGTDGIKQAYRRGRGHLTVRAKTHIEEHKGRQRIIVAEIPYQVNKSLLLEQMAFLVKEKRLPGISDIRDESDREGMRVVIELKGDANSDVVLNRLFKMTKLQTTFGVINLALVDHKPRMLPLKDMLHHFVEHRRVVVVRRTQYDLRKAEERLHILEGLIRALDAIDAIVSLIRKSKDGADAKEGLMTRFAMSELQAKAILDMRLQRLAALEQKKVRDEQSELLAKANEYRSILASEAKVMTIIRNETVALADQYGDPRRTKIMGPAADINIEDIIDEEDVIVTCTHEGYIKRMPMDAYRQQQRGGKGVTATDMKDEDFVDHLFIANTHSYLLMFTNKGKVHWVKVYDLPVLGRYAKGKPVVNIVESLDSSRSVRAMIATSDFSGFLFFATKNGIVKKTPLDEFSRPRKGGIIALGLDDDDELVDVRITSGKDEVLLASADGMAVRFNEQDVRSMGRGARGVKGIKVDKDSHVIGLAIPQTGQTILSVTETGTGKRSRIEDYRLTARGGKGVINIRSERVAAVKTVDDTDELMVISQKGILIRVPMSSIPVLGRATQGVRIMRLESGDKVVAAEKIHEGDS